MRTHVWALASALLVPVVGLGAWVALYNVYPAGHLPYQLDVCEDYPPHLHLPFDRILWP